MNFNFLLDSDNFASLVVFESGMGLTQGREKFIRSDANRVKESESLLKLLRYVCPYDTFGSRYM